MKVVLASGCFDPLHYGHLLHFEAAKKLGDWLVVAVTDDAHVNKPGRPIFPQEERAAMVKALRCVDDVAIVTCGEEAIKIIKPDVFVKGKEYEGRLPEQAIIESLGGKVVFTDDIVYSSTRLVTGGYLKAEGIVSGGRDN